MANDMPNKRDEESGRFTESVTDDEILDFISGDGGATSDVAKRFDVEHTTAYRRLKALEEEGRIKSRTVGSSLLWTIDEEG